MSAQGDDLEKLRLRLRDLAASKDDEIGADELFQDLQGVYDELAAANAEIVAQHDQILGLLEGHDVVRAQHERMFATLPLPLMTTDTAGMIRSANSAAAELVGSRPGRLVGTDALALVAADDRADLRGALAALDHREATYHRLVTVLQRGPDLLDVEATLTVLPGHPRAVTWALRAPAGTPQPAVAVAAIPEMLARLSALPLVSGDVRSVMAAAADLVADGLGDDAAVSICLGSPLAPTVTTSSSGRAQEIDGAQVAAGEGPCVTAYDAAITVETADMGTDERWPRLASHLPGGGSAVGVPLTFGGTPIGTFNVYCRLPDLDIGLVEACELLGATVASVVYEQGAKSELTEIARGLERALESRAVIEQAKGVVMATKRCDADQAFDFLVDLSSTSHVKLRALAQRIVAGAVDLGRSATDG